MATLHITTNADSGDGSLRALLASASAGDVIEPDPTVFPVGTVCEISVATSLNFTTSVTIRGAQTRIRLVGNPAATQGSQIRAPMTFVDVDFWQMTKAANSSGGLLWHYAAAGACSYTRCTFNGNYASQGGVFYVASGASVSCDYCEFLGNCAWTASAVVHFASTNNADSTFSNCLLIGNVAANGNQWNRSPTLSNCSTSVDNAAVPPSESYSYSTWTNVAWRSWVLRAAKYELAEAFDCAWVYYDGVDVAWLN